MADVHVKGLAPLQKLLDELPVKIERNVMRSSLREGAKAILAEATYRAPSKSAALVSSLRIGTRVRGSRVTAYVKTDVWYARFVEFGTRAHTITAKNRKGLSFGGLFFQSVDHPGAVPHPFMRTAMEAAATNAVVGVAEHMKKILATREGLDTSHIMIAGDE